MYIQPNGSFTQNIFMICYSLGCFLNEGSKNMCTQVFVYQS